MGVDLVDFSRVYGNGDCERGVSHFWRIAIRWGGRCGWASGYLHRYWIIPVSEGIAGNDFGGADFSEKFLAETPEWKADGTKSEKCLDGRGSVAVLNRAGAGVYFSGLRLKYL